MIYFAIIATIVIVAIVTARIEDYRDEARWREWEMKRNQKKEDENE